MSYPEQPAVNKQPYLENAIKQTREEFLEFGFQRLYRLIAGENQEGGNGGPPV